MHHVLIFTFTITRSRLYFPTSLLKHPSHSNASCAHLDLHIHTARKHNQMHTHVHILKCTLTHTHTPATPKYSIQCRLSEAPAWTQRVIDDKVFWGSLGPCSHSALWTKELKWNTLCERTCPKIRNMGKRVTLQCDPRRLWDALCVRNSYTQW